MRLLLLGTALLSGGGAVAMQNEDVQEHVYQVTERARYVIQHRVKKHLLEEVKETGFPYPPQAYLDNLTDEQEALVLTTIDQINAEYDWASMTDEEIIETLKLVKADMDALYEELGIDGPTLRQRVREYVQERRQQRQENRVLYVQENGIPYPNEDVLAALTEDQSSAITALIDQYNTDNDWATMTTEEIQAVLETFQTDMIALKDELGITTPLVERPERPMDRFRKWYRNQDSLPEDDVPDDDLPEGTDQA
jgi:hypothetical protein